jgi:hypothetical protein
MNYFLMLVILLLGGGGFYEYNIINSRHEGDVQRLSDLSTQVDTLKEQNTKLTADNAQLTKSSTDAEAKLADLTKQVQDAQSALAVEKQKEDAAKTPAIGSVNNPMPTPGTNDLGTIGTLDGKVYPNSTLMKVQADCIVISYTGGITQIAFSLMQPELQKRFGFDPKVAFALTADQVGVQELKRKAAGSTAGN